MTLQVYTARISSRDPDRLDITRNSAGPEGIAFAPSWAILRPALDARREAERIAEMVGQASEEATGGRLSAVDRAAALDQLLAPSWEAYASAYLAEMRTSYRANRAAWDALLARSRVVLLCYCTDAAHCHRTLLAERCLRPLGVDVRGEA